MRHMFHRAIVHISAKVRSGTVTLFHGLGRRSKAVAPAATSWRLVFRPIILMSVLAKATPTSHSIETSGFCGAERIWPRIGGKMPVGEISSRQRHDLGRTPCHQRRVVACLRNSRKVSVGQSVHDDVVGYALGLLGRKSSARCSPEWSGSCAYASSVARRLGKISNSPM